MEHVRHPSPPQAHLVLVISSCRCLWLHHVKKPSTSPLYCSVRIVSKWRQQVYPQRFTRIIHVNTVLTLIYPKNTLNTRGITLHCSGIDKHRFSDQWSDAINSKWKHQSILWVCALILKSPWQVCITTSVKVHLHPKHLNTASTRRMMASSQERDDEDIYRRSLWILNSRNLLVSIAGA